MLCVAPQLTRHQHAEEKSYEQLTGCPHCLLLVFNCLISTKKQVVVYFVSNYIWDRKLIMTIFTEISRAARRVSKGRDRKAEGYT